MSEKYLSHMQQDIVPITVELAHDATLLELHFHSSDSRQLSGHMQSEKQFLFEASVFRCGKNGTADAFLLQFFERMSEDAGTTKEKGLVVVSGNDVTEVVSCATGLQLW
jgi:hypothetical protein